MKARFPGLPVLFLALALFWGCNVSSWNQWEGKSAYGPAPDEIQTIFSQYPHGILRMNALSPGYDYAFDIGEKDVAYGDQLGALHFRMVELKLQARMPAGKIIADLKLTDQKGSVVSIPGIDLLRLVPRLDAEGDLIYPEIILEELNRFGVSFRREHNEFQVLPAPSLTAEQRAATQRAYRASLTNNCLHPGKWEVAITAADFSDFPQRTKSGINVNQNRILAHSWFQLDKKLYHALLELKNPGKAYDPDIDFDSISNLAEQVIVDFEQLRKPIRRQEKIKMLEVGHQSGRKVEPVDVEEHFKYRFGLWLNRDSTATYTSILEQEVRTAKFRDEGFYRTDDIRIFNFDWMKHMDSVAIEVINVPGSETYVQLRLTGRWSWYEVTIGNVDLALLNEQKRFGLLFGINTYPKSRRFNPPPSTIQYDFEVLPPDRRPFVLLTEKQSGKWVNNQYKGIEKIYMSYETRERDVLEIYVLSYERITPVWMARVKLSPRMRELVRVKNALYNY